MKILHTVQLYEPHKGGSEEVVKQISERLVARGHEVVVATRRSAARTFTVRNGVKIVQFDVSGNEAIGINGEPSPYLDFVKSWDGDVMLNYAAQIWSTDLLLDHLAEIKVKKVLVPCGYSGLTDPRFGPYFAKLPARIAQYDFLVYMSRNYQDYEFGTRNGLEDKAVVIPNGAAEEEFLSPSGSFRQRYGIKTRYMVLTVSNHHKSKGHGHLIRAMRGMRDSTLVIVGEPAVSGRPWIGCLPKCKAASALSKRVMTLNEVPREDVIAAYREADIFALASEIECAPLVIYESMAAGTAFVSLRCGNVQDNAEHGVIVDSPAELEPAIRDLLDDADRRKRLGASGHKDWLENYTWEKITDQYEALYRRLTGAS